MFELQASRPSAQMVAIYLVYLRTDFEKEHSRKLSRFRVSIKTLRNISKRFRISEAFAAEIVDELGYLGWTAVTSGDYFAIIRSGLVQKWSRVSDLRVGDELDAIDSAESSEFRRISRIVDKDRE